MATSLTDTTTRTLHIEGDNALLPGSVFINAPEGACYEIDRATFLEAIKTEFGLVDPLDQLFNK